MTIAHRKLKAKVKVKVKVKVMGQANAVGACDLYQGQFFSSLRNVQTLSSYLPKSNSSLVLRNSWTLLSLFGSLTEV